MTTKEKINNFVENMFYITTVVGIVIAAIGGFITVWEIECSLMIYFGKVMVTVSLVMAIEFFILMVTL